MWVRRSLRSRLTLAGAVAILAAVTLSAAVLAVLFDRHVERVAIADLHARVFAVAAMVETEGNSPPVLQPLTIDPLYERPFSGHYWQLSLADEVFRSRSLWDSRLDWPADPPAAGQMRQIDLTGPQGEALLGLETILSVGSDAVPMRILAATDREDLVAARRGFLADLLPFLGILGVLLVIGSWLQVRTGLGPLNDVSGRVAAVRGAAKARIGTDLPTEILPLAQEIDLLLDERDENIERARHRAADLAHGFKTPLQALFGDAAELQTKGETHLAESIETIASSMQTLVDRELKRARILSDQIAARAEAGDVVRRVVEVLRRTPGGKSLEWTIESDSECHARIHADDLMEAMGAILENACRFAKSYVAVRVGRHGQYIEIRTQDDGPGVTTADLSTIIRRGVRLDEATAGNGIGLALASETLDAAGAHLSLRNASPGLEVIVRLRAVELTA